MVKAKQPNKTADNGRKANGQFGAGNDFGERSGPYSKQDREWKRQAEEAMRRAVPVERLERIMDVMAQKAEDGNAEAAKFIADRLLGKAPQQLNVGGADGGPLELTVNVTPPKNK